ncbi:MAG: hypothetical protein H6782_01335 [Candidatus Nomurabacteria bacterium]|nr:MAG: hypothetical protein H6782_01335 [Candidatus Nomurabacteria bacterium]
MEENEIVSQNTVRTETAPQTDRLIDVLKSLEGHIKEQNSFKYSLFRGMAYGLGTVIGATVLVALFGGIIATTLSTLTGNPVGTELLEKNSQP